jgi:hypothetical protein
LQKPCEHIFPFFLGKFLTVVLLVYSEDMFSFVREYQFPKNHFILSLAKVEMLSHILSNVLYFTVFNFNKLYKSLIVV